MHKILVIGDTCQDWHVYCSVNRFCPDAPVPVLNPIRTIKSLGMAGNVVDNMKSLGANVDLISNSENIKKIRYVDDRTNHMFIRIDEGETNIDRISKSVLDSINWSDYASVIISDYCKGFLFEDDIAYIATKHPLTFLDTKKILNSFVNDVSFIKINYHEYDKSKHNISSNMLDKLIVTLGRDGAMFKNKKFEVKEVDIRDTSGAGDTFLAGLVYKYLHTLDMNQSILFANECATQVVQKKGTAKINLEELNA